MEQAYSPDHMLLPSRGVMTARKQIFFSGIPKAYNVSAPIPKEKIKKLHSADGPGALDFALRDA